MNLWTNEEIEKILVQLDQRKLPFEKYTCVKNQSSLQLLGRGGSANVYEAEDRKFHKEKFAIKGNRVQKAKILTRISFYNQ